MARVSPFLFLFAVSVLIAMGCATPPATSPSYQPVTDDLGRTVMVPASVERVVTIAPNLTEIVFAAGAGHKLVGVTTADNYPPAVDTLPRFGALPLDFEAIAALEPDLVLANNNVNNPRDAATFAALDLPVLFYSFEGLGDVLQHLHTFGDLLDTAAEAQAAAATLEADIAALRQTTNGVPERPLTLFLIGDEILYAFGRESYMHGLIALAGGRSATEEMDIVRPVLSEEFVLTSKPEVIFGAWGEAYDPAQLLKHHPTWDIVPALRDGRVYSLDPDLVLRPTPRLLEGVRRMARHLHPALFVPAVDTVALPETP